MVGFNCHSFYLISQSTCHCISKKFHFCLSYVLFYLISILRSYSEYVHVGKAVFMKCDLFLDVSEGTCSNWYPVHRMIFRHDNTSSRFYNVTPAPNCLVPFMGLEILPPPIAGRSEIYGDKPVSWCNVRNFACTNSSFFTAENWAENCFRLKSSIVSIRETCNTYVINVSVPYLEWSKIVPYPRVHHLGCRLFLQQTQGIPR